MSEKNSRRRQVRFTPKKKGFNFFCCTMDAPSPEPPAAGAALAAAPAPAEILADAVAAVANAAAAVAGDPPLASASNSSSSSTSVGDQQQSLEFDSTAACVGLGGSAWTCFKKELPDSQIATRCGGMEEEKRRGERERENPGRERRASKSIAGEKTDAPLIFSFSSSSLSPLPLLRRLTPPKSTQNKTQSLALDGRGPRVPAPVLRPAAPDPDLQDEAVPPQPGEKSFWFFFSFFFVGFSFSFFSCLKEVLLLLARLLAFAFSLTCTIASKSKTPFFFPKNSGSTPRLSPRAKRKKTSGRETATAAAASAAGGEAAARSTPRCRASSAGWSPS